MFPVSGATSTLRGRLPVYMWWRVQTLSAHRHGSENPTGAEVRTQYSRSLPVLTKICQGEWASEGEGAGRMSVSRYPPETSVCRWLACVWKLSDASDYTQEQKWWPFNRCFFFFLLFFLFPLIVAGLMGLWCVAVCRHNHAIFPGKRGRLFTSTDLICIQLSVVAWVLLCRVGCGKLLLHFNADK